MGVVLFDGRAVAAFYPHPFIIEYFPDDVKKGERSQAAVQSRSRYWLGAAFTDLRRVYRNVYIRRLGRVSKGYSYVQFFVRFLIMLYGMKAFAILFFDYFILMKTQFFQHFFPETEGCAGRKKFGYNRTEQIKKLIMMLPCAAVNALICWWIAR